MTDLPADLREAIALGIARGYYTHTCVEEIEPLITAALADAWDAAQRAFCNDMYAHAAHQDCDDPGECPTTPNPYAPAERSGWEDHAPAEARLCPADGATCNCPAAPSGVAQPIEGEK